MKNLLEQIKMFEELQSEELQKFLTSFSDKDQVNSERGYGLTSVITWKAEKAMEVEAIMRELEGAAKYLEKLNSMDEFSEQESEANERLVVKEMLEDWTREIMRGVGGSSTCPLTNFANAKRQDALRRLVEFFKHIQSRQEEE
jgi:hypothetical protein